MKLLSQQQQQQLLLTPQQRAHLLMYSHAESPCGSRVVFATNFGHLLVFDVATLAGGEDPVALPARVVPTAGAPDSGVYALATVAGGGFLAAGCAGRVLGYRWPGLVDTGPAATMPTPAWQLELPSPECEANAMAALGCEGEGSGGGQLLAVGCGDGSVRLFDLGQGGRLVRYWPGEDRSPPVLRVAAAAADAGRGLLAVADESGAVRLLDPRKRSPRCQLRPAQAAPQSVARPALGDWLGCLACRPDSADWLACGGGPRLAVWHAANLTEPVAIASAPDRSLDAGFAPMCAAFSPGSGERLLAGGNAPLALQFASATGALMASAGLSCGQALSVGCLRGGGGAADGSGGGEDDWRLVACGLGPRADVFSNLGYRLFSLAA